MRTRTLTWMFVALALMLLPTLMSGCGADDADSNSRSGGFTIGPGNWDHYPVASGAYGSLRD